MKETVLACAGYFLLWTLLIYWVHRLAHMFDIPFVTRMHWDHHKMVTQHTNKGWHWTNAFLFFDSWRSTLDNWFTETIPTIVFCIVFQQWWLLIAYYLYAAFIQEAIEHNPDWNFYPFNTSGQWHLVHHEDSRVNFGVFFPIWDIIFGTRAKI